MIDPKVLLTRPKGLAFNAARVRSQLKRDNPLVRNIIEVIWSSQEHQKKLSTDAHAIVILVQLRDRGAAYYDNLKSMPPPKYLVDLVQEMKSLVEELSEVLEDLERLQSDESKEDKAVAQLLNSLTL
jgi:hypothetical protein